MEVRFRASSLKSLLPFFAVAALVGGFMALDRGLLHWYVPSPQTSRIEALETATASMKERISFNEDRLFRVQELGERVDSLEEIHDPVLQRLERDMINDRFVRIASAVTVNSLSLSYGGDQRSDSPAGKACYAYLFTGVGSITDCGFTR